MDDRLDLSPLPRMVRVSPAARIAHELLRTTLTAGKATRMLNGLPSLVVVHGLHPSDAKTMDAAAQDFDSGSGALELVTRDWTDPDKLREDHLRRLFLEASTTRRAILVLLACPH